MKHFFSHRLANTWNNLFFGRTLAQRYIVSYLVRFHSMSLAFLVLFVLLGQIWEFASKWLQAGVGVVDTAHLILLLIPSAFIWAMSFALMLGVFFTLVVLKNNGELVAIWFMGLEQKDLAAPIIKYSITIMFLTLFLSHTLYPYSMDRFTYTFNQLIFEKPVIQFKDRSILWLNGRLLAVASVNDLQLHDVILLDKTSSPMVIASAEWAHIEKNMLGQTFFVMDQPWLLRIPSDPRLRDFTRLDAESLSYPLISIKGAGESSSSSGTADLVSTWNYFREAHQRVALEKEEMQKRFAIDGITIKLRRDFDLVKSGFILGMRWGQIICVPLFTLLGFFAYFYFPRASPVLLIIGLLFFALMLWLVYYLLAVVVVHGRLPLGVLVIPLMVLVGTVLYFAINKRKLL